jgi:acetyl-CoA acetyltransferase
MTDQFNGSSGHVYVVSAARTPIGKFGGALAGTPAVELGGVAIPAAVERAGLPDGTPIDEVHWDKVNVNGRAIALGHLIGASGARVVAALLHELNRRQGRYGLATLCLGGGGSVAAAFERVAA